MYENNVMVFITSRCYGQQLLLKEVHIELANPKLQQRS